MTKLSKLLIATGLVASSIAVASAQSFKAGPYAGLEFGAEKVQNQTQSTANALVAAVGGSASVTQDTTMYDGRIFGGYKIVEYVDLELGYTQTSTTNMNYSGRSSGGTAYSGNANLNVNGADYSVLLRPSIASGFNGLFFRVGGSYLS